MTRQEIMSKTDLTLLKADINEIQMIEFLRKAIELKPYSVCINPYWSKLAKWTLNSTDIKICTVIDFPLGASSINSKLEQIKIIIDEVDEIDYVLNIGKVKSFNWDYIYNEAFLIRREFNGIIKCIIETCYLTFDEITEVSIIIIKAGIDFIKTSSGMGTDGARFIDCVKIRNAIGETGKIKASGGIKTYNDAERFLETVNRIGSSGYEEDEKDRMIKGEGRKLTDDINDK